ncbi:MAG: hypothetical protein JNL97_09400, partial [Verrucomicrobiales bacterium]|nr:hypothetical protein [Verrucomicrobiales bacterium]
MTSYRSHLLGAAVVLGLLFQHSAVPVAEGADVFVQGLTTVPASAAGAGVTSFAVDSEGNRYVFGELSGQVTFAPQMRVEGNGYYLARRNRDDTWSWVKLFEGVGARIVDLAVVSSGPHAGVYVAGHASSTPAGVRYDGRSVPTEDTSNASFVLRVDRDTGVRDTSFLLTTDQGRGGVALARIRSDGSNLYAGGTLDARVKSNDTLPDRPEDSVRFPNPTGTPAAIRVSNVGDGLWANESDLWLARFDLAARRWRWVFVYGGPRDGDVLSDIELEPDAVHFAGAVSDSVAGPNVYGYRVYDETGTIVSGLDPNGVPVSGPGTSPATTLPPRSAGARQAVVGTLNPATGALRRVNQANAPGSSDSLAVDLAGGPNALYLVGAFRNTLTQFAETDASLASGDPLRHDGGPEPGGGFVARLSRSDLRVDRLVQLDPAGGYLDAGRSIAAVPN